MDQSNCHMATHKGSPTPDPDVNEAYHRVVTTPTVRLVVQAVA